jgi:hypothetical protein
VLDVTARTYDVWIRGGVYTGITKIVTAAGFRNPDTSPVDVFYARASTGFQPPLNSDFTIYDDIWVDTGGQNLFTPNPLQFDPTQGPPGWIQIPMGVSN